MGVTYNGVNYTIVLDASFDLHQSGHDNGNDAQQEYEAAYRAAARDLADESGIAIRIIVGSYQGPAMLQQTTHGDEGDMWQDIHNRVYHDGGEWMVR